MVSQAGVANADTQVMKPLPSTDILGHVETFMDGRADFLL